MYIRVRTMDSSSALGITRFALRMWRVATTARNIDLTTRDRQLNPGPYLVDVRALLYVTFTRVMRTSATQDRN